jgi:hypothetical protein
MNFVKLDVSRGTVFSWFPNTDQNKSCLASKVIELCSWTIFYLNYFCWSKVRLNFWNLKICFFSNGLKWRNSEHESCRSWEVVKLRSLQIFYLKSYCQWNPNLNLSNLKFKFINDLKWKNFQHESCRSHKVMKLCSWHVFNFNPFSASKNRFTLGVV